MCSVYECERVSSNNKLEWEITKYNQRIKYITVSTTSLMNRFVSRVSREENEILSIYENNSCDDCAILMLTDSSSVKQTVSKWKKMEETNNIHSITFTHAQQKFFKVLELYAWQYKMLINSVEECAMNKHSLLSYIAHLRILIWKHLLFIHFFSQDSFVVNVCQSPRALLSNFFPLVFIFNKVIFSCFIFCESVLSFPCYFDILSRFKLLLLGTFNVYASESW